MFQEIELLVDRIRSNFEHRHLLAETMEAIRDEVESIQARIERLEEGAGLRKPADDSDAAAPSADAPEAAAAVTGAPEQSSSPAGADVRQ
ncbi:hypothetical protein [Burkholderia pseudomallei]|uniref:hypothetical protein n=1 Tax=Burkholderia pseudomallei TaxID=28450 RepID=UPI00190DAFD7|nr:hypothetical protein [Burkholderia pseudomallei]MBK3337972.1 hypothetical protein [Burkholderia pseudomallei]